MGTTDNTVFSHLDLIKICMFLPSCQQIMKATHCGLWICPLNLYSVYSDGYCWMLCTTESHQTIHFTLSICMSFHMEVAVVSLCKSEFNHNCKVLHSSMFFSYFKIWMHTQKTCKMESKIYSHLAYYSTQLSCFDGVMEISSV